MEGDYNILTSDQADKGTEKNEADRNQITYNSKCRFYFKNIVLLNFSIVFVFAAAYSSSNLLTTIAGKTLGFVSLAVFSFVGFAATCISPALMRSFGLKRIVASANFFCIIFVASQFYVSYFTLIPGAFFQGLAMSMYWIGTITYLNKLAISYANEYNESHVNMMCFVNGVVMASFAGGVLLGNAISSSLLLPSGLDEQYEAVGNGSCNLEPRVGFDPYNEYLLTLRGALLLCVLISFTIVMLCLDDIREEESVNEKQSKSVFSKVFLELQNNITEIHEIVIKTRSHVLFCLPLTVSVGIVESFTIGSFPKVCMMLHTHFSHTLCIN